MISRLVLLFLFSLSSCALFKTTPSLRGRDVHQLLKSIKAEGEGRGRLTIRNQQNVFSYDAILKDNSDWLLAVSIPLHGEEVMILPQLKDPQAKSSSIMGFEARIEQALEKELKDKSISAAEFSSSLRSLLRFILADKVEAPVSCQEQKIFLCRQLDQEFEVQVLEQEVIIGQSNKKNYKLLAKAKILTDSFFSRTEFIFQGNDGKEPLLTLELFWK